MCRMRVVGITAFNIDFGTWTARTLINVAPRIAERNRRWGSSSGTGLVPFDAGVSASLDLFRSEMTIIEQYRPSLLQPFAWGSTYRGEGHRFRDGAARSDRPDQDGTPSDPRISIDAPRIGATVTRPFVFSAAGRGSRQDPRTGPRARRRYGRRLRCTGIPGPARIRSPWALHRSESLDPTWQPLTVPSSPTPASR